MGVPPLAELGFLMRGAGWGLGVFYRISPPDFKAGLFFFFFKSLTKDMFIDI